jgi:hypothetical protein
MPQSFSGKAASLTWLHVVCECVCVWEREAYVKEGERERENSGKDICMYEMDATGVTNSLAGRDQSM